MNILFTVDLNQKEGGIKMQNEFVGKLVYINLLVTAYMDCPNEGSGNPDCNCDMVDGS